MNYDLLLDLLVANFYMEPNCLYVQQPDHTFVDSTRSTALYDASFPMLGFGTQFLDGELDGWPDLVVANGHLMDETDLGVPYQMRPQYFRNEGDLQFDELRATCWGRFSTDRNWVAAWPPWTGTGTDWRISPSRIWTVRWRW